eukprot:scaffold78460_cov27-Tisochrysis_lutea.AAC.1
MGVGGSLGHTLPSFSNEIQDIQWCRDFFCRLLALSRLLSSPLGSLASRPRRLFSRAHSASRHTPDDDPSRKDGGGPRAVVEEADVSQSMERISRCGEKLPEARERWGDVTQRRVTASFNCSQLPTTPVLSPLLPTDRPQATWAWPPPKGSKLAMAMEGQTASIPTAPVAHLHSRDGVWPTGASDGASVLISVFYISISSPRADN